MTAMVAGLFKATPPGFRLAARQARALGEKNRLRMKHLLLDFLPAVAVQREEAVQPWRT